MLNLDGIYLDYNASSLLPAEVIQQAPLLLMDTVGNPSSVHKLGRRSRRFINDATEAASLLVGCQHQQIFWTASGSEANSWVLHSAFYRSKELNLNRNPRFLVSSIEHESVLLAADWYKTLGAEVVKIPCTQDGVIDLQFLEDQIKNHGPWDLVSVQYANSETGVIQPVNQIASLCQNQGIAYHCDAVQVLGKIPLKISESGITYATFSCHKIGAPKGAGFVVNQGKGRVLYPLIHGKQQRGLRGGTENPFAVAVAGKIMQSICKGQLKYPANDLESLKTRFEQEIQSAIPGTHIHGVKSPRLPNTSFIGFEEVDGDSILMGLDLEGIYASSGSACSSGSTDPSYVLLAMGCNAKMARSSVRFSSGYFTKWSDYEKVLAIMPEIVARARKTIRSRITENSETLIEV